jgi:hypothetical protein
MPGPPGFVYAVQIYDGCEYCETPAAVILTRFTEDFAAQMMVREAPEIAFNPYVRDDDSGDGDRWFALLDGATLQEEMERLKYMDEHDWDESATTVLRNTIFRFREKEDKRREEIAKRREVSGG